MVMIENSTESQIATVVPSDEHSWDRNSILPIQYVRLLFVK